MENFRGGQPMDFGSSWTKPHRILDSLNAQEGRDTRYKDVVMFYEMTAAEEDIKCFRKMPKLDYCTKLRSWTR